MLFDASPPNWIATATFVVQVLTLVGAAAIACAALMQAATARRRHEEQTKADRERRITESMGKAGEQLGSDKIETRLVGIYTLERIARESASDYWPIIETLMALVRERAQWPPRQLGSGGDERKGESTPAEKGAQLPEAPIRPPTDIQAVLTVLGRRDEEARKRDEAAGRRLELTETDLRGANLGRAHLERAWLLDAHLEGAELHRAHLESAWLLRAHLEGANLKGAHLEGAVLGSDLELVGARLEGADLWGAHLEGAWLLRAHLEGANLVEAHLEGADLREAHLEGAELLRAHLEGANLRGAYLEGAVFGKGPAYDDILGARLEGADLRGARGLTREQLAEAVGDAKTQVADELRPMSWPAAAAQAPDNPE